MQNRKEGKEHAIVYYIRNVPGKGNFLVCEQLGGMRISLIALLSSPACYHAS